MGDKRASFKEKLELATNLIDDMTGGKLPMSEVIYMAGVLAKNLSVGNILDIGDVFYGAV